MNRASAAVASSGIASNYLVTLEVTGRKSGRTISLPLVMAVVDGQRYLLSMLGDDVHWVQTYVQPVEEQFFGAAVDRKSTRLNSSHGYISYAVFCLKKKKK